MLGQNTKLKQCFWQVNFSNLNHWLAVVAVVEYLYTTANIPESLSILPIWIIYINPSLIIWSPRYTNLWKPFVHHVRTTFDNQEDIPSIWMQKFGELFHVLWQMAHLRAEFETRAPKVFIWEFFNLDNESMFCLFFVFAKLHTVTVEEPFWHPGGVYIGQVVTGDGQQWSEVVVSRGQWWWQLMVVNADSSSDQ